MTHGLKRKVGFASFPAMLTLLGLVSVAYACTNYVGVVQVWGDKNRSCSGTIQTSNYACTSGTGVIVTGKDSWNGSGAMTQSVNSTISHANTYSTGNFYLLTSVSGSNSLNPTGSDIWYDVNTIPVGYTSHTTWGGDPNYDCMDWILGGASGVKNVGSVKIHTDGAIIAATNGTRGTGTSIPLANPSTGLAGPFPVASNETNTNTSPKESGVCVSDSTSTNGNQMPLTLG